MFTFDINVIAAAATQLAFKNCASFTKCIKKIDETTIDDASFTKFIKKIDERTIDDAENLGQVMPMYNLIEHSSNYSETMESLWFYFKGEAANFNNNIANTNNFKSFKNRLNY